MKFPCVAELEYDGEDHINVKFYRGKRGPILQMKFKLVNCADATGMSCVSWVGRILSGYLKNMGEVIKLQKAVELAALKKEMEDASDV